jgi:hypothetical protein
MLSLYVKIKALYVGSGRRGVRENARGHKAAGFEKGS